MILCFCPLIIPHRHRVECWWNWPTNQDRWPGLLKQDPNHNDRTTTPTNGLLMVGPWDHGTIGWPTSTTQNNEGQPTSPAPLLTGGMRVLVTNDRPRQPLSPVTMNAWRSDQGQLIRGRTYRPRTPHHHHEAMGCCQVDYCESILAHCKDVLLWYERCFAVGWLIKYFIAVKIISQNIGK
jgi:hypothetical protein